MTKPARTRAPSRTFTSDARKLMLVCAEFRQQLLAAHASPTPVDVRPLLTALEHVMAHILPALETKESNTIKTRARGR